MKAYGAIAPRAKAYQLGVLALALRQVTFQPGHVVAARLAIPDLAAPSLSGHCEQRAQTGVVRRGRGAVPLQVGQLLLELRDVELEHLLVAPVRHPLGL